MTLLSALTRLVGIAAACDEGASACLGPCPMGTSSSPRAPPRGSAGVFVRLADTDLHVHEVPLRAGEAILGPDVPDLRDRDS